MYIGMSVHKEAHHMLLFGVKYIQKEQIKVFILIFRYDRIGLIPPHAILHIVTLPLFPFKVSVHNAHQQVSIYSLFK